MKFAPGSNAPNGHSIDLYGVLIILKLPLDTLTIVNHKLVKVY